MSLFSAGWQTRIFPVGSDTADDGLTSQPNYTV